MTTREKVLSIVCVLLALALGSIALLGPLPQHEALQFECQEVITYGGGKDFSRALLCKEVG